MSTTNYTDVLLAAGPRFDQVAFMRTCRSKGHNLRISTVDSMASLRRIVDVELKALDVVVLDYALVESAEDVALTRDLLGDDYLPVVGLFEPGEEARASLEMGAGLCACVLTDVENRYLWVLGAAIAKASSRKKNYVALEEARQALDVMKREKEAFLGCSLTLVSFHDSDTRVLWSNAIDGEAGLQVDHLADRFCHDVWREGGDSSGKCPVATAIRTGEPVEAEVQTMDGYAMIQRACPVKNEFGDTIGAMACTLDMSAVSPGQEALYAAAKVQAAATLAGGIAHKFNNLMAGILANASLVGSLVKEDPVAGARLSQIEASAMDAGALCEQLLAFSRGGHGQPRPVCLNHVLQETLTELRRGMENSVELALDLEKDLWNVCASSSQLGLMFAQIFNNAVEAVGAEGRISIVTRNKQMEEISEKCAPWITPGRYVVCEVRDNGVGMNYQVRNRIFEPFFTTKADGRGLGLAGAYGIVRSYDGHITVESSMGEGTSLRVFLPASNVEALPAAFPQVPVGPPRRETLLPTGCETLMVVENEEVLRTSFRQSLERLGYRVLEACDSDEAMEICRDSEERIHLVLLDMIMPGVDGMEVYYDLRRARPDMDVLVMSAYDRATYEKPLIAAGACAFLQKPVPMDVIAKEIRRALDSRQSLPSRGAIEFSDK